MIRSEQQIDYGDISKVNDLAFGQKNEGEMIINLRANKEFIPELSLVYEEDNKLIGHILFYPLDIVNNNIRFNSLSLAPVAVLPDFQNMGIGSQLIEAGLSKAKEMGFTSCVVLGHPEYYPKFGFERASIWNIKPPVDEIPDEAFMAVELVPGSLKGISGVVEFPKEYYDAL